MAKKKSDTTPVVTIAERDYLTLIENTMVLEAMKLAGIESHPVWKAVCRILDDDRVQIHIKPLNRRYAFEKD